MKNQEEPAGGDYDDDDGQSEEPEAEVQAGVGRFDWGNRRNQGQGSRRGCGRGGGRDDGKGNRRGSRGRRGNLPLSGQLGQEVGPGRRRGRNGGGSRSREVIIANGYA